VGIVAGVVVVVFLQLFPKAKRRQLKGALDAYQAAQREQARTGSDQTSRDNQAPTAR
jgi:type II secretory pathway pseudopilin PulG